MSDCEPSVFTMPTVFRFGPFSFVFFSSDHSEPRHIPVKRDGGLCKFWLEPIALAKSRGFTEHELNEIERLVSQHAIQLREAWDDFFGA